MRRTGANTFVLTNLLVSETSKFLRMRLSLYLKDTDKDAMQHYFFITPVHKTDSSFSRAQLKEPSGEESSISPGLGNLMRSYLMCLT